MRGAYDLKGSRVYNAASPERFLLQHEYKVNALRSLNCYYRLLNFTNLNGAHNSQPVWRGRLHGRICVQN